MKITNHVTEKNITTSGCPAKPTEKNIHTQQNTDESHFDGVSSNLAKIHNSPNMINSDEINPPNTPQKRLDNHERISLVLKWVNMSPKERKEYNGNGGIQKFVSDNNAHYSQFMDLCRMNGKLSARGMGSLRRYFGLPSPKITAEHIIEWKKMSPENRAAVGGLNCFAAKYSLPSTQLYRLISATGKIKSAGLKFLSKEISRKQNFQTPESSPIFHTTIAQSSTDLCHVMWELWENDASQAPNELRSKAVMIMRNCLERKSLILNLSNLNLTSLPDIIPGHILELRLINNNLSSLPENLPQNLQQLFTADNVLTALPQILPEHIIELCLQNNTLTKFPEHLPETISHLDISFNKMEGPISHLPDSLNSLDLSNNKLTTIPDSLPGNLTWIDLSNNQIETLPACAMNISEEKEIDLINNPLTEKTLEELYEICDPKKSNEAKNIFF